MIEFIKLRLEVFEYLKNCYLRHTHRQSNFFDPIKLLFYFFNLLLRFICIVMKYFIKFSTIIIHVLYYLDSL